MRVQIVAGASLLLTVAAACGSSQENDGGSGGSSGFGGNLFNSGGSAGSGATSTDGCSLTPDETGCVGERFAGETVPLDIYILFDQSYSMSCTIEAQQPWPDNLCNGRSPRINPVREAITSFLNDPLSAGIGVGIGYFGNFPLGETSCNPDDYSNAAVSIAPLPGNASAVIQSLNGVTPTGETPTGAAVRGACDYLSGWASQNPSHKVVLLLVTDGVPETPLSNNCRPAATIQDAVTAVTECRGEGPGIDTYVVGVGQALNNLNQIASAGGTEQAYLVDGGNVSQSVLSALNSIRGNAQVPCELRIPEPPSGDILTLDTVNIGICDATGENVSTYKVSSPQDCGAGRGGWYYVNEESDTRVVLCEPTCQTVTAAGATLFYSIGCTTTEVPR